MASDQKTEKATPRRRQKARERGGVPRTRELPEALGLLAVVLFFAWRAQPSGGQLEALFRAAVVAGTGSEFGLGIPLLQGIGWTVVALTGPALLLSWGMAVAGSVAQGGFVFAPAALSPQWARLSPAQNVKRLFSLAGWSRLLKSLLPTAVIAYVAIGILAREWEEILQASRLGARSSLEWMLGLLFEICWKVGLVLLLWSGLDYLLQRIHLERGLRMSRQEVREEMKETEGNPTVRGRVRRLQREMRRRRMLRDLARATVVITNPNEYAVALEYQPETTPAPVVLAKGRNLVAREIKRQARWHSVPIVENPPLAQALYRAVEIGQAIPPKLYAAVAEILAFLFRTQTRWSGSAPGPANRGRTPGD